MSPREDAALTLLLLWCGLSAGLWTLGWIHDRRAAVRRRRLDRLDRRERAQLAQLRRIGPPR